MISYVCQTADQTRDLGQAVGRLLRAGDLVLLHGELGAGKTTFTQGLARGLGVAGRVMSPTFIVARIHESEVGGPDLIHVDAYRIEDDVDLETLDLDSSLEDSVTVIEWGAGKAEVLSVSRLEITLEAQTDAGGDWQEIAEDPRTLTLRAVGEEWQTRLEKDFTDLNADQGRA